MSWYNPFTWFQDTGVYYRDNGGNYNYELTEPAFLKAYDNAFKGHYSDENLIALFHSVPEVFAPVHEIASRVSDAIWQMKRTYDDQVDYNDEAFNRLFSFPNPLFSCKKLIYQAVCYELVTGKQYFYANVPESLSFDYRNISALWSLHPCWVKPRYKNGYSILRATTLDDILHDYHYKENEKEEFITPEKILPVHQISLHNCETGKSALLSAEKAIRNLIAVYEARGTIYLKRGALGFIVSKKSDESGNVPLTAPEKKQLRDDFNETYGITPGKSPVAITGQPVDFVRTAMSIQEMQPFEETLADAVAIYKVLRVPRHLVPSKDQSTFSNADSDMKSFYSDVIIPMAKGYAEAFTNFFRLTPLRKYIDVDFSHVDVLQENKKEKAEVDKVVTETYIRKFQTSACSLNEYIIATAGTKGTLPIYDKKWLDMSDEERESVAQIVGAKQPQQNGPLENKDTIPMNANPLKVVSHAG